MSVRAEPRLTRDADLAVAVNGDEEAETLVRQLSAREYGVVALVEQEATGRLSTVRLGSRLGRWRRGRFVVRFMRYRAGDRCFR